MQSKYPSGHLLIERRRPAAAENGLVCDEELAAKGCLDLFQQLETAGFLGRPVDPVLLGTFDLVPADLRLAGVGVGADGQHRSRQLLAGNLSVVVRWRFVLLDFKDSAWYVAGGVGFRLQQ